MKAEMTAKDVMNPHVLAVGPDWPIAQLADFLVEHDISGAPVLSEGGTLCGVVSLTDIVRHVSMPHKEPQAHRVPSYYVLNEEDGYTDDEWSALRLRDASDTVIRDIMTPTLFTVSEDTPVVEIADMMIKGHIHRVFVTRNETVHGLVTALDLLRVIRDA